MNEPFTSRLLDYFADPLLQFFRLGEQSAKQAESQPPVTVAEDRQEEKRDA